MALKIVDLPTFGKPTIPHLKPMAVSFQQTKISRQVAKHTKK
jgi:hypothetical protein